MSSNKILLITDGFTEELTLADLLNRAGESYTLQVLRLPLHPEAPVSHMQKVLDSGRKKLAGKKLKAGGAAALSDRFRKVILVIDYESASCIR